MSDSPPSSLVVFVAHFFPEQIFLPFFLLLFEVEVHVVVLILRIEHNSGLFVVLILLLPLPNALGSDSLENRHWAAPFAQGILFHLCEEPLMRRLDQVVDFIDGLLPQIGGFGGPGVSLAHFGGVFDELASLASGDFLLPFFSGKLFRLAVQFGLLLS